MDLNLVWGIIALVCGTFMLVYGATLIRVVLAFAGFYLGFVIATIVLRALGIAADNQMLQLLVEIIIGAILGIIFYNLVSLTVYVAGGILGLVVGLFVTAVLGFQSDCVTGGIALVAAVMGGIFGRN